MKGSSSTSTVSQKGFLLRDEKLSPPALTLRELLLCITEDSLRLCSNLILKLWFSRTHEVKLVISCQFIVGRHDIGTSGHGLCFLIDMLLLLFHLRSLVILKVILNLDPFNNLIDGLRF